MAALATLAANLTSPAILAFLLGLAARAARSDLRLPEALSQALAIYLLFAIGLKGGASLAQGDPAAAALAAAATVALALIIPLWVHVVARRAGGMDPVGAASLAAHYGSTSAVTFLAAGAYLERAGEPAEGFATALLAIMEIPAIAVAQALIARHGAAPAGRGEALRHVLAAKSLVLLLGGLAIGWIAGEPGLVQVAPFFVAPFHGVLCLFLLDLGLQVAGQLPALRAQAAFLVPFALLAPLVNGAAGVAAGTLVGLSPGGATLLGVLAGSASYIAAPAAMRAAAPGHDHTPALAAALGITFPFNLALGIPLLHLLAGRLAG